MNHPSGLGRLTRAAICGLLAAAALPATALADGLPGGAPVAVPSTSVTTAVSTPSLPVAIPSASASTHVATPVASAKVTASTSKPAATATVSTGSHSSATTHRSSAAPSTWRAHRRSHARAHRSKPQRKSATRTLAASSNTFELYIPTAPLAFSCTGASVALTGAAYFRITTFTSSDGNLHMSTYLHFFNVTGTNTLTGTKFVSSSEESTDVLVAKPSVSTLAANGRFVTSGELVPLDDFYMHSTVHTTIDANGIPTATVDNTYTNCQ